LYPMHALWYDGENQPEILRRLGDGIDGEIADMGGN